MNKKWLIILIIILIVAVLFLVRKNNASTPGFVTVNHGNIIAKITAIGNIMAVKTASVKSPIAGTVAYLFHDEGDYVKKGEQLLEINPEPTPDAYVKAKQQVEIDLAKEQMAAKDVTRFKQLLQLGAISKNDQDYAKALEQFQTTQQQRIQDEQLLSLLERGKANIGGRQIGNIINSPIEGYVVERDVNIGDPVTAQSDYQPGNVLFVVADMKNMIFKGQVSETDAAKLHLNMPATIKIAALPDVQLHGVLSKLSLQSAQASTTNSSQNNPNSSNTSNSNSNSPFNVGFKVEISQIKMPANLYLRAGYSATADIVVDKADNALMIPERVLQFDNDKTYVWLLNDKKPEKRYIKTSLSDGMNVQVLSGLALGDKILEQAPDADKDAEDNKS